MGLFKKVVKAVSIPKYLTHEWIDDSQIRSASGSISLTDPLECFLYLLLRDHLVPNKVEALVEENRVFLEWEEKLDCTDGWSGRHAQDLARRLRL